MPCMCVYICCCCSICCCICCCISCCCCKHRQLLLHLLLLLLQCESVHHKLVGRVVGQLDVLELGGQRALGCVLTPSEVYLKVLGSSSHLTGHREVDVSGRKHRTVLTWGGCFAAIAAGAGARRREPSGGA